MTSECSCAARTPVVQRVESLLSRITGGGGIVNDHVAFRTFGARGFGIESIVPAFTDMVRTPLRKHAVVTAACMQRQVSADRRTLW